MPRVVLKELAAVDVAFGRGLGRVAGDDGHVEEAVGLGVEDGLPTVDEGEELLAEHAVEDGSAADDKVVLVPVDAFAVGFKHVHHVGLVAFGNDGFPNAAGDTSGMAGAAVVNNKHRLHVLFSKRVAGAQATLLENRT